MLKKAVTGLVAGVIALGGSVVVGTGTAQAAPAPPVKVCAKWAHNGAAYKGPLTLVNRDWWVLGRTLNASPRGCMVWNKVQPKRAYRVVVNYRTSECFTSTRADGSTYRWGIQTDIVGQSAWKVAPRSGQLDLGTFRIHEVHTGCM